MPIKEILDEGSEADDAADRVYAAIQPVIRRVREARVARAGAKGVLLRRLEVRLTDDDDANEIARKLAERLVEIALDDANTLSKMQRYTFAALGEALPNQRANAVASVSLQMGDGDRDSTMAKQTTALLRDHGDRAIRALDSALAAIERAGTIVQRGDAGTVAVETTKVELAKLGYQAANDERSDQIVMEVVQTIGGFARKHGRLFDGLGNLFDARARVMYADLASKAEEKEREKAEAEAQARAEEERRTRRTRRKRSST